MSGQIINLNDTSPPPASGYQDVKWQKGATTGNDPTYGLPIFPVSAEVPNTGGVAVKTANYTATAADCGTLLVFNSAGAVTLTLPAAPPFVQWNIAVQNIGAGALTVSRNGLLIDTAAANLTFAQNSGCWVYTDVTNYFTERGAGGAGAVTSLTTTGSSGAATLSGGVLNIPIYSGGGGGSAVLTRQCYNFGGRVYGTVYHNTSSFPILVLVCDAALAVNLVAVSDSSVTPTTIVWSMRTYSATNAFGSGMFLVMPGDYYKVTGSSLSTWNEYSFTKGSPTSSGNLSGSRALATVYQNLSGNPMFVSVYLTGAVGGTSVIQVFSDSSVTPTTTIFETGTVSTTASAFFIVPPGDYYKVTCSGAAVATWIEVNVSALTVTKTLDLLSVAGKQNGPLRNLSTGQTGFGNATGQSRLFFVTMTCTVNGTLICAADPYAVPIGIFQVSVPLSTPATSIGVQGATEFASCYRDSGVSYPFTAWFEYALS